MGLCCSCFEAPTSFEQYEGSPICCIINKKSGGQKGDSIYSHLASMKQCYVFNIMELVEENREQLAKLREALQLPNVRVMVGGGDGSIIRVFELFDVLRLSNPPPVGIIPLGVGNELSRCLGWSSTCNGTPSSVQKHVKALFNGNLTQLDRWDIEIVDNTNVDEESIKTELRREAISTPWRSRSMICFFSIGFDALISHKFHTLRETKPHYCSSVGINKFWHAWYGAGELLSPSEEVSSYIEVRVNGTLIPLPPKIRTLQILNIHSSADGVDFFGGSSASSNSEPLQTFTKPSLNDGMVEVVGTESIFHLMTTRVKLTHSRRIAQANHVSITTRIPLPAQLDGEPYLLPPSTINITFHDKVNVVQGFSNSTRGLLPDYGSTSTFNPSFTSSSTVSAT
eukprot:TRINITY_DN552_c0_g3_i4.p1 TRINITY_DN552_c0_g3~~TRINITY_DN552_c0_g3_i4.p1  ORF type:complete len:397 (+),score=59.33 TRINITY_DN552_c0_g3_i4:334-1524(+)